MIEGAGAVFLFLPNTAQERVLNVMRDPKLAHILVFSLKVSFSSRRKLQLKKSKSKSDKKLQQNNKQTNIQTNNKLNDHFFCQK